MSPDPLWIQAVASTALGEHGVMKLSAFRGLALSDVAMTRPSAIVRNDSPAASPLEISSRPASERYRSLTTRARGRIPPDPLISFRSETFWRPIVPAMCLTGTPAWCMSQIRSFPCSVNRLCTPTLLIDNVSVRQSGLVLI
jgi:hypothetical protein